MHIELLSGPGVVSSADFLLDGDFFPQNGKILSVFWVFQLSNLEKIEIEQNFLIHQILY
jgi:hypothetical protein